MITCANPKAHYLAHKPAIDAAVARVLGSGTYILGEEVRAFEAEFSGYIGGGEAAFHSVGTASGTDALHLALRACGIGPGDEVITTAFTAVGTVAAIELAGAVPVFADIDPVTLTLDPVAAERAVTPRTRALLPVHLYGGVADLDGLLQVAQRHGLRLIEDCAQAHGARYRGERAGSFGDFGCFSCYPTKNLGALGDAGVLVTRDPALAEKARRLAQYGWDADRLSGFAGINSRLDALQAAVLRVKLPFLEGENAARGRVAALYDTALPEVGGTAGIQCPRVREGGTHVYHLYTVRAPNRDGLRDFLGQQGIETRIHYEVPVHKQPAYRGRIQGSNTLFETECAAREVLSLPMHSELLPVEIAAVTGALRAFSRFPQLPGRR